MTNTKSYTDRAKLELYQISLTNAKTKQGINQTLDEFGISNKTLDEGFNLYNHALKAYNNANTARINQSEAFEIYDQKSKELERIFSTDWKKANIAFFGNTLAKNKLELGKSFQQNRLKQFDMATTFYTVLSEKPELLEALSEFKVTAEDVSERLTQVRDIEKARANYIHEKGISQTSTLVKKEAMNLLSRWMTKFYAGARNAFKDEPQMMESLGWVVK